MPIDPKAALMQQRNQTAGKQAAAGGGQMVNLKPMGRGPLPSNVAGAMEQKNRQMAGAPPNPAYAKKPGLATAPGLNKKKPTLAPGSVRANQARADAAWDLQKQNAIQQNQAQAGALDVGPSQLPFEGPPPQEMIDPSMGMAMGVPQGPMQEGPIGGLNAGPQQLPFLPPQGVPPGMNPGINPMANNPMNSRPGQFGPVNPQIQGNMMRNRMQNMQQMDQQRNMMQQRRMRGGY